MARKRSTRSKKEKEQLAAIHAKNKDGKPSGDKRTLTTEQARALAHKKHEKFRDSLPRYSLAEVAARQEARSPRARALDAQHTSQHIIDPRSPYIHLWMMHPEKFDTSFDVKKPADGRTLTVLGVMAEPAPTSARDKRPPRPTNKVGRDEAKEPDDDPKPTEADEAKPKKGKKDAKDDAVPEKKPSAGEAPMWGMDTLMMAFDAAGVSRADAKETLKRYRQGRGVYAREEGPFLVHEQFVRRAVERGEDVPRAILELHPHLLPEAKLLHGVDPKSREATLINEARALGWIGFDSTRTIQAKGGRWWSGDHPGQFNPFKGEKTALAAVKKAWNEHGRHGSHPVLGSKGPSTLAEQRKLIEKEEARLRKRYAKFGLPTPKVPVGELYELRKREAVVAEARERKAGLSTDEAHARRLMREANARNADRANRLEASKFWDKLPPGDPDGPRYEHMKGKPDTRWANDGIRDKLTRMAWGIAREKAKHVSAALADQKFVKELDPYILKRIQKVNDDLQFRAAEERQRQEEAAMRAKAREAEAAKKAPAKAPAASGKAKQPQPSAKAAASSSAGKTRAKAPARTAKTPPAKAPAAGKATGKTRTKQSNPKPPPAAAEAAPAATKSKRGRKTRKDVPESQQRLDT